MAVSIAGVDVGDCVVWGVGKCPRCGDGNLQKHCARNFFPVPSLHRGGRTRSRVQAH